MKINNYDDAKNRIRTHLTEYLETQGIVNTQNFHCINPKHNDGSPSCGILPDQTHFHCFGCGMTGDIFDAAHLIEDKPLSGINFVADNLLYLAKFFSEPVEMGKLSQEETYRIDTARAYTTVLQLLKTYAVSSKVKNEVKTRGWSKDVLSRTGTGSIEAKTLLKLLKQAGWEDKFLHEIQLDRTDIFSNSRLVFTITDPFGKPVGFAARNLNYTNGSHDSKYVNFSTSGRHDIYQKSKRLYNLHVALPDVRKGMPLYIMEGYSDVLTLLDNGISNCVAIGGTALTDNHVLLLRELGIDKVVLCFDGDEVGQDKVQKLLDEKLKVAKDINVKIVVIPDGLDPDGFVRENGPDAFRSLTHWTAFEWRLNRYAEEDTEPEDICNSMIPLIASEPSVITQEKMCATLAERTGVSLKAIRAELRRILSEKDRKLANSKRLIFDKLVKGVNYSENGIEELLSKAQSELRELNHKYDVDKFSIESTIKLLDIQKDGEETHSDEFQGFRLGPDLSAIEEALAGEWKKDVLMLFGGKANSGKTSLLAKMAYHIAIEEDNDAIVIYHTIDDSAQQFLPKWICIAEGTRQLTINEVRFPAYYARLYNKQTAGREVGYQIIRQLMAAGRLVLKDSTDGNSLSAAESMIKYYRDKFPNRNLVYVADNMHKFTDFQSASDQRMRHKTISERAKEIATREHMCFMSSVEYTKLPAGTRPTNYNISETVQLEYDGNFIAHLYNEVHELGEDKALLTHNQTIHGKVKVLPVIELAFGKNKISDFKNKIFLDFYPASSDFVTRDTNEIEAYLQQKRDEAKNNRNNKSGGMFG